MKLIKVTCELRFADRVKLLAGYENMHRELLRTELKDPDRWLVPGLRLEDRERKRVMIVDPTRSVIDVQEPPNVGFCRDSILQFYRQLEKEFGVPEVARWGLRSTWIEEHKVEFKVLLAQCKQRIFGDSALLDKVDDLAAVFDHQLDDGKKLAVNTGPMQADQLRQQFLPFQAESLPSVFLYIDVDMGDVSTKQYSAKYLAEFVNSAIQRGETRAAEVVDYVGVTV